MAGLRCWILLSRHSSVVSRVPRPFTSIEPPSRTTRAPRDLGRISRECATRDIRPPIFSSSLQFEYLAQALNRKLSARWLAPAPEPCGDSRPRLSGKAKPGCLSVTKMHPESRTQTRFVRQRERRQFAE